MNRENWVYWRNKVQYQHYTKNLPIVPTVEMVTKRQIEVLIDVSRDRRLEALPVIFDIDYVKHYYGVNLKEVSEDYLIEKITSESQSVNTWNDIVREFRRREVITEKDMCRRFQLISQSIRRMSKAHENKKWMTDIGIKTVMPFLRVLKGSGHLDLLKIGLGLGPLKEITDLVMLAHE